MKNYNGDMIQQIIECYHEIYDESPSLEIKNKIAEKIPMDIRLLAFQWGWDDTEVGDKVYRFIRDEFDK